MKVQFTSANLLARSGLALSVIALFAAVIVLAGCSSPPRVGATDVNCDLVEKPDTHSISATDNRCFY